VISASPSHAALKASDSPGNGASHRAVRGITFTVGG
jgi:hypothetical protein